MAVSNQRISQSYTVTRDIKSVETKMLKLVLAIETYRMPMQNWFWIWRCSQIKIELLAAVLAVFPNTNAFFSQSLARLRKRACVKHWLPSTKKAKDSYMTASKISQAYIIKHQLHKRRATSWFKANFWVADSSDCLGRGQNATKCEA